MAAPALLTAGALMAGAQLYKKALLVLAAGQFRPITLAGVKVPRQVSNRRTA